jgi:hypothetical protein
MMKTEGYGSGFISKTHGSADPHYNVMGSGTLVTCLVVDVVGEVVNVLKMLGNTQDHLPQSQSVP